MSVNVWQELEPESEPKIGSKVEPESEPKINNFGSATLVLLSSAVFINITW